MSNTQRASERYGRSSESWAGAMAAIFNSTSDWTTDNMDRIRAEAASLLASNVDVIVALGGRVIPVLRRLSRNVPIVIPGAADPVMQGWVDSLARPGGNITGFTFFELSILGKQVETLKQLAPTATRSAFIYNPDNPVALLFRQAFEVAAAPLGLEPFVFHVHSLPDIERAIASVAEGEGQRLFPARPHRQCAA